VSVQLDAATQSALHDRLRFYRELGLAELYTRPLDAVSDPAVLAALEKLQNAATATNSATTTPAATGAPAAQAGQSSAPLQEPSPFAALSSTAAVAHSTLSTQTTSAFAEPAAAATPALPIAPEQRPAALQLIRSELGDCTRCGLHAGRNHLVFADGDANARIMFVGEGPGADEDAQGLPFVGKAGQLLNNMITAMGLRRDQVYIANVVKCRPPENRMPEPDEANTCLPFLLRQIDVVQPEVLVALGSTAATYLLGQRQPLAGLRGRIHNFRQSKLIITYHPAFLLRDPRQKKEAWADLQIAMAELGLKPPSRG